MARHFPIRVNLQQYASFGFGDEEEFKSQLIKEGYKETSEGIFVTTEIPVVGEELSIQDKIQELITRSVNNPYDKKLLDAISVYIKAYPNDSQSYEEARQTFEYILESFIPVVVRVLQRNLSQEEQIKINIIKQEIAHELPIDEMLAEITKRLGG